MENSNRPALIEPGVRYFIGGNLKQCHIFKDEHTSIIFNISMFVLLVVLVGGFLLYRYRGKLTPEQLALKNKRKQEYIFTKLKTIATQRQKQSQDSITNLPGW